MIYFFLFNFHFIILTSLKCLFHKIFIQNIPLDDLNTYEINLFNNYKYLIINNKPLTFKFLDYSKDNLNNYDYVDIQYIILEFNTDTYIHGKNIIIKYHLINKKIQLKHHPIHMIFSKLPLILKMVEVY